ncbi:MAG TPA: WD40 repeat domain-containing protein [Abditibacteriaceae bacterium]|jgi:WD40 repeat protein
MKRFFALALVLASLAPLQAQPPVGPSPQWTVKEGNPATIEEPTDWSGYLSGTAFSPDGALLAVTGTRWEDGNTPRQGLVMLSDARTGAFRGELREHTNAVQNLAFSPDGKLLATQSQDGALFIWDVAARTVLYRLSRGTQTRTMEESLLASRLQIGAWSPDGKTFAAYELKLDVTAKPPTFGHAIKFFDVASGKVQRALAPRPGLVMTSAWTADSKNFVTALNFFQDGKMSGSAIEVLDRQTGEIVRRVAQSPEEQSVSALNHDATRALITHSVSDANGRSAATEIASLRDVTNDQTLWTKTVPTGTLRRAQFSRDGGMFVAGNADGEITLRDTATGEIRQTLPAVGCSAIERVALSPDARRIASVEEGLSSVRLWKLDEALPVPRYASQTVLREIHNLRALDWSGDTVRAISENSTEEKDLRVGQDIQIDTWSLTTSTVERRAIPEKHLLSAGEVSPDGNSLAVQLGTQPEPATFHGVGVGIYDLREGKLLRVLPGVGSSHLVWAPDGKTVASVAYDSAITLWDAETGERGKVLATTATTAAWSLDGKTIASGGNDGTIEIFDALSGAKLHDFDVEGAVRMLCFSPDSKTLAVGKTEQQDTEFASSLVELRDALTGEAGRTFVTQPALQAVLWTPDGSAIAASSLPNYNRTANGQLHVWDVATGEERIAIDDRCGIGQFVFSSDGKRIATHSWNRVRVWELK